MAIRKQILDLDGNDKDNSIELKINKNYAEKYSTWRQKEELQKLKSKYGDEVDNTDSSSSEEEDENAEALTDQLEKDWLRTLAAVKSKDPRIYQQDVKFYHSEKNENSGSDESDNDTKQQKEKGKKAKDGKSLHLRDFERKFLLEKGGVLDESEDEVTIEELRQQNPSYFEEQEEIKKSIKQAIEEMDSDENESYLKTRRKTKEEKMKEEEEYLQWLKGEKSDLKDTAVSAELAPLKTYWSKPDLSEGEKYLRDFILNKTYLDKDEDEPPTYEELMKELSEDEHTLENQDEFERKYNFRFEEPDSQFIKSYPRVMEDTVRKKDVKRSVKRQLVKERKLKEKEQKKEEIKQLKNLKKKEIMDRLEQLKEATGNATIGFSAEDIEEDFDPEAHDKMMQKYFGDEFYEGAEDEKPEFSDDIDDGIDAEDWDTWEGPEESSQQQEGDENVDNEEFNMDADYDPSQASYTSGKKKKRKSKFAKVIEKKKPTFEEVCQKYQGKDHPFGEYLEEYYKLDCEDIIAGEVKCRFRYRQTVPNDYGLTVDEILKCSDRELNAWAALKKITQYRTQHDEVFEVKKYKKAKMQKKKLNILPSLKESSENDGESATKGTKHNTEKNSKMFTQHNRHKKLPEKNSQMFTQHKKLPEKNSQMFTQHKKLPEKTGKKRKRSNSQECNESSTADKRSNSAPARKKEKNESDLDRIDHSCTKTVPRIVSPVEMGETTLNQRKKEISLPANSGLTTPTNKKIEQKSQAVMKKQRKKKKKAYRADQMSDERLRAYGLDPRKFKYTKHLKLKKLN